MLSNMQLIGLYSIYDRLSFPPKKAAKKPPSLFRFIINELRLAAIWGHPLTTWTVEGVALLSKPYVSTKGEGVKNTQKSVYVIY